MWFVVDETVTSTDGSWDNMFIVAQTGSYEVRKGEKGGCDWWKFTMLALIFRSESQMIVGPKAN